MMALIDRTIYPRLNNRITKNTLLKEFTLLPEELTMAYTHFNSGNKILTYMVLYKVFKKIRYFPKIKLISPDIIDYIKKQLNLTENVTIESSKHVIYTYQRIIRVNLNVISNRNHINSLVIKTVEEFEPLMNHPADVYNAVIETLIKSNCELPAFSTLERLINDKGISIFNHIKELPKSPTLSHMKAIKENYLYLRDINYGSDYLRFIHPSKIKYFAARGSALDASEMKDFIDSKRYTIMLCFIHDNTIKTCDNLITMFIKRISRIHSKAKEKLDKILEKQRTKTENIIEAMYQLLICFQDCEEITAYNNKNYYPFLWSSFKSHRKTLFEIIKVLEIESTTQNEVLIKAINYLIQCENRKSEYIDGEIDIFFASEKWQKLIKCKYNDREVFSRRYYEMCIFSYIASDFKTGDVFVENSDEYADYRKQLLPWDECKPLLENYCNEMDIPLSKEDFINELQRKLKDKSQVVDRNYPYNSELIISDDGEVMLKRKKSTRNKSKIKKFKKTIREIYA